MIAMQSWMTGLLEVVSQCHMTGLHNITEHSMKIVYYLAYFQFINIVWLFAFICINNQVQQRGSGGGGLVLTNNAIVQIILAMRNDTNTQEACEGYMIVNIM